MRKENSIHLILIGILIIFLSFEHLANKQVISFITGSLLVLNIGLISIYLKKDRLIKEITTRIKEVTTGNYNARIFMTTDKSLSKLAEALNQLLDVVQDNQVRYQISEESRKKLLANISHDLRTPLTSIIGYVEALQEGVISNEKERAEFLEIIYNKAKHLKKLIEDIFYTSRIDANDLPLEFEVYDLGEILRESLIDFLPEIKKYKLKLEVNIPEDELLIYADKVALQRVFANLLKNSIMYGKDGGEIGVDVIPALKECKVNIRDKGPGIDAKDLPYIFDRLYVSDKARKKGGSGLGLAIAKKLVERHGGNIELVSIPEEKTVFTITLPGL